MKARRLRQLECIRKCGTSLPSLKKCPKCNMPRQVRLPLSTTHNCLPCAASSFQATCSGKVCRVYRVLWLSHGYNHLRIRQSATGLSCNPTPFAVLAMACLPKLEEPVLWSASTYGRRSFRRPRYRGVKTTSIPYSFTQQQCCRGTTI